MVEPASYWVAIYLTRAGSKRRRSDRFTCSRGAVERDGFGARPASFCSSIRDGGRSVDCFELRCTGSTSGIGLRSYSNNRLGTAARIGGPSSRREDQGCWHREARKRISVEGHQALVSRRASGRGSGASSRSTCVRVCDFCRTSGFRFAARVRQVAMDSASQRRLLARWWWA